MPAAIAQVVITPNTQRFQARPANGRVEPPCLTGCSLLDAEMHHSETARTRHVAVPYDHGATGGQRGEPMSGGHDHTVRASRRHFKPLAAAFVLVVVFLIVEAVAGFWTGSLALISDAGHMATDALGIGMALAAIVAAERTTSSHRTYGLYRTEILAALANAVLLFAVAGYVVFEALRRFADPPDILSGPMIAVAVGGLIVNVVAWRLLRAGADESLNIEGAYLEVIADLIGSVGVLIAAVVIWTTDWTLIDPIVGAAIGLFILPRAWRLARKAFDILLQSAPERIDLDAITDELAAIPEVMDVHDLHVWTLTSDMDVGTAHLMTRDGVEPHPVLDAARLVLQRHGITHATLQVEPESHEGCSEMTW